MGYLLDTNVFVAAKDHYHRPRVCPGFWRWLESSMLEHEGVRFVLAGP